MGWREKDGRERKERERERERKEKETERAERWMGGGGLN